MHDIDRTLMEYEGKDEFEAEYDAYEVVSTNKKVQGLSVPEKILANGPN